MPEYYMPRFEENDKVTFPIATRTVTAWVDEVSTYYHGGFFYTCSDDEGNRYTVFDPMSEDHLAKSQPVLVLVEQEEAVAA